MFFLEEFLREAGPTEPAVATKNLTKESANKYLQSWCIAPECPSGWGWVFCNTPCAGVWDLQLSAVGWDHSSSHKAVVAFSKETQWAGHSLEHLSEEKAGYGPTNQSRPLGGEWPVGSCRVMVGSWWLLSESECCPGSRRNGMGNAPAMSTGSLSALRPSFPCRRWSLR